MAWTAQARKAAAEARAAVKQRLSGVGSHSAGITSIRKGAGAAILGTLLGAGGVILRGALKSQRRGR